MNLHVFIRAYRFNAVKDQCCVRNLNQQSDVLAGNGHISDLSFHYRIYSYLPLLERPTAMFPLCF